jgi:hypothetical protein
VGSFLSVLWPFKALKGISVKLKLDRIISLATLTASLVAIVLVLKRPTPVAPQAQAPVAAHSPAFDQQQAGSSGRTAQQNSDGASVESSRLGSTPAPAASQAQTQSQSPPQQPHASAQTGTAASPTPKSDANINSEAISSMLAKTLGAATGGLTPDSNLGSGEPNIKDQQVTMDGDIVHGKFLTEIAGKDVWVTISGHMGEKDGYATFDPTEFKVGDMDVPVELVNPALQRKLAEERDRLKVPNNSQ